MYTERVTWESVLFIQKAVESVYRNINGKKLRELMSKPSYIYIYRRRFPDLKKIWSL